jgi:2-dehydrotetronate isomerase
MPKFAANLTLLFTELPYLDRFKAAADAGFEAVEVLFPYDVAVEKTYESLVANGLELVLINAPPLDDDNAARGFAAMPVGEDQFEIAMQRVLHFANVLGPTFIHVMSGYTKADAAEATFVRSLQWAADLAPQQNFTIEPLNSGDQPGYFLDDYDLAARILGLVDRPNVGLQYDSYHAQLIHGDALQVWQRFKNLVTHVQIGAAPSRSEPGPGPIDFSALFHDIDASGYAGWISAEYHPTTARTEDSLGWMA